MKNALLFVLLFTSLSLSSQNKLDEILLDKINEYRNEIGLNRVEFNETCFNAAECQSRYLGANDSILTHNQKETKFKTLSDRVKYFGGDFRRIAEVCNAISLNAKKDSDYLDMIADKILTCWKNSKGHNDIITDPSYTHVGISVDVKEVNSNFKNYINHRTRAVAVFVKNN